ncbi:MAG: glucokinase [Syntrophobacteria bacterium]
MLLAGDIGGTKTSLAIFRTDAREGPIAEASFENARYPDLTGLVREFLEHIDLKVERACFGVAGPVVGGRVATTNLPWVVEAEQLREAFNLVSVQLLNDLEAIAHAVPLLKPDDLHILNRGKPAAGGAMAVLAPGTGLGEAFLVWDGSCYRPHPSEGGHVDFAPTNPLQIELLHYLQSYHEHVSYERICSGLGLPNIYAFLRDRGYEEEPAWLAERLGAVHDPTPVIVNSALDRQSLCDICVSAVNIFASILGAEAGNLALKVLATGGLYLGGGIPPRILSVLEEGTFMEAFRRKGRMSDLVEHMPVQVILNPNCALLGAAAHGLESQAGPST